jgi:TonB family protein
MLACLVIATGLGASAQPDAGTGDAMRDGITRAKSLIAARDHSAAVVELESLLRIGRDDVAVSVVNVMLMHCYVEKGDFWSAERFAEALFDRTPAGGTGAAERYLAVAGQVAKDARDQAERLRSLGMPTGGRGTPQDVAASLEGMRGLLEKIAAHSMSLLAKAADPSALLPGVEDVLNARGQLARDDYDFNRWKEEIADAQDLVSAQPGKVYDALDEESDDADTPATSAAVSPGPAPAVRPRIVKLPTSDTKATESQNLGSLMAFAVERPGAVYPANAKNFGVSGLVRVDLLVGEDGTVEEILKVSGPLPLQNAAREAAAKWKFRPFTRDGRAIRTAGFLVFDFNL